MHFVLFDVNKMNDFKRRFPYPVPSRHVQRAAFVMRPKKGWRDPNYCPCLLHCPRWKLFSWSVLFDLWGHLLWTHWCKHLLKPADQRHPSISYRNRTQNSDEGREISSVHSRRRPWKLTWHLNNAILEVVRHHPLGEGSNLLTVSLCWTPYLLFKKNGF